MSRGLTSGRLNWIVQSLFPIAAWWSPRGAATGRIFIRRSRSRLVSGLAQAVCVELYGQPEPAYGPMYKSVLQKGERLVVEFDHCGSGLVARDGMLKSFEIAAHEGTFVAAHARIDGNTIEVWSEEVPEPAAVRYAWAPFPFMDLFNQEGLPASPFTAEK